MKLPRHAVFAITPTCNYRCKGCEVWKFGPYFPPLKRVKEILLYLKKANVKFLLITGGEPTLYPDLIEVLQFAKKLGFFVGISTNGSRPDVIKEIAKIKLSLISISLDSCIEEEMDYWRGVKGAWENSIKSIKICKKLRQPVSASILPTPLNSPFLIKTFDFCKNVLKIPIGICTPEASKTETWKFKKYYDDKFLLSVYTKILKVYDRYPFLTFKEIIEEVINRLNGKVKLRCWGGTCTFYVDWYGNVFPCFNKPKICSYKELPRFNGVGKPCFDCLLECFLAPSIIYDKLKRGSFISSLKEFLAYYQKIKV